MADVSTRKEKALKANVPPGAETRFTGLMRRLLGVSKMELDARERGWKEDRKKKRKIT